MDYIDPKEMIALEEELHNVKREYGISEKPSIWIRLGDWIAEKTAKKTLVNRKRYIFLALTCGWFSGSHRFYTHQPLLGILYLLFCWTGIPLAMTMVDLMIVLPKKVDELGRIEL